LFYPRVVLLYQSSVCAKDGGEWTMGGIAENQYCVYSFDDGGKSCHNSEECMGGCVIYDPPVFGQPLPTVGVCRYNSDPFVCHAPISYPDFYGCAD